MVVNKKQAYLNFRDYLDIGQQRLVRDIDIREKILSIRHEDITIGFLKANLEEAYASNLSKLFPKIKGVEDNKPVTSEILFSSGTIYSDPGRSHGGACHIFTDYGPGRELYLVEMGFLASTHGWMHSFKERRPELACLGYIYDDVAHYFMADYPNRLIQKLNSEAELTEPERRRAQGLIDRIVDRKISKYNAQPFTAPVMTSGYSRRVLVCDQSYADASTIYGKINTMGFESMLLAAIQENPDAEILVKSHPDTYWEKTERRKDRSGYYEHLRDTGRVRILREPVNPYVLFDLVDTVYVGTSQMGLEALFAGKKVVCFGAPFYAGWGLTDDRQPIPHRHRNRSLEDLFHYFYDWYTIYHVPGHSVPSTIENVLDYIEWHRPYTPPIEVKEPDRTPKISVILPVYGVEEYIEECITSIQRQTLEEIEIIPVNDQSPDGSQEIIDRLAAEDPRIKPIILKENVGQGFARNFGIKAARGEYVWLIDSDDYMPSPNHLSTVYLAAKEDNADMVRGRKLVERIEDVEGRFICNRLDSTERFFDKNFRKKNFSDSTVLLHSRHHCLWLYRREFLLGNSIEFTTARWEERPFLLKAFLRAKTISTTSSEAFVYRIRQNSTTRSQKKNADYLYNIRNFKDVVTLLFEAGAFCRESRLFYHAQFTISQYLHYMFFGFAYDLAKSGIAEDNLHQFIEKIRDLLEKTRLQSRDIIYTPLSLSKKHSETNAYKLIFAAVMAREYSLIEKAIRNEPIPQDELYSFYSRTPQNEVEEDLQYALNLYARNGLASGPEVQSDTEPTQLPRIIIHIGATKTGSTYLQHLMDRNRPALLRQGVWYPERGLFQQQGRPHKVAGHARFAPGAVRNARFLLNYLMDGLRLMEGRIHTIVLSSEAFFLNARSNSLADYFQGFDVQMIAYLRRQDEWANAQYAEFVAGGAVGRTSKTFDEWLEDEETLERLNYLNVLNRWQDKIGQENVIVRPYERSQFRDGDLVADFAAAVSMPQLLDLPRPEKSRSNSFPFGNEHITLFRHFNQLSYPNSAAYLEFVEEATQKIVAYREEAGRPIAKPWLLEDGQSAEILSEYAQINEEIARQFMGREDGQLFEDITPREGMGQLPAFDAVEFDILAQAYSRQQEKVLSKSPAKPKKSISLTHKKKSKSFNFTAIPQLPSGAVFYGLLGWRRKVLAPVIGKHLKSRIPEHLYKIYEKEPYLYFNNLPHTNQKYLYKLAFPKGNIYGPLSFTKIWVPVVGFSIEQLRGKEMRAAFEEDPVVFFRNTRNGATRLIGRLLFPFGEVPNDVRAPLREAGFVIDWQKEQQSDRQSGHSHGLVGSRAAE